MKKLSSHSSIIHNEEETLDVVALKVKGLT
jgi:hypothetical protein